MCISDSNPRVPSKSRCGLGIPCTYLMVLLQCSSICQSGSTSADPVPVGDGDPEAVNEQDGWARTVQAIADSFADNGDDESDDVHESETEHADVDRSNENLPCISLTIAARILFRSGLHEAQ